MTTGTLAINGQYGTAMTDSPHLVAARDAEQQAAEADRQAREWRDKRNRHIVLARTEDGVGPTEIARALDQSVSNIGLILRQSPSQ